MMLFDGSVWFRQGDYVQDSNIQDNCLHHGGCLAWGLVAQAEAHTQPSLITADLRVPLLASLAKLSHVRASGVSRVFM